MRSGLLRGRDHLQLGAVAALAERRVAIALSRGGAAKTYQHQDPNEDACAFAWTEHAWLVAVADGHWGHGGAELALARPARAPRAALDLAGRDRARRPLVPRGARRGARPEPRADRCRQRRDHDRPHDARARAGAAARRLVVGAAGRRQPPVRRGRSARERVVPRRERPGDVHRRRASRPRRDRTRRALRGRALEPRAIVLATDGLSEPAIGVENPARAVAESVGAARAVGPELRPLTAVRGLAERALAAQRANAAGDNVATACVWLAD
jgi:serine/threonine protein phosphatase PrpC